MPQSAHACNFDIPTLSPWLSVVIRDAALSSGARHLAHIYSAIAHNGMVDHPFAKISELTGIRAASTLIELRGELERRGHVRALRSPGGRLIAVELIGGAL